MFIKSALHSWVNPSWLNLFLHLALRTSLPLPWILPLPQLDTPSLTHPSASSSSKIGTAQGSVTGPLPFSVYIHFLGDLTLFHLYILSINVDGYRCYYLQFIPRSRTPYSCPATYLIALFTCLIGISNLSPKPNS